MTFLEVLMQLMHVKKSPFPYTVAFTNKEDNLSPCAIKKLKQQNKNLINIGNCFC